MKDIKFENYVQKGVFVGLVHDDMLAHLWLLEELNKLKPKLKYFFVEANHENIEAWHNKVQAMGLLNLSEEKVLAHELYSLTNTNPFIFAFLYARYILKLEIIGIDSVSEEDRNYLNLNKTNTNEQIVKQCLDIRLKNNSIMATNIQDKRQKLNVQDGEYVVVGGLAHYEMADILNINNMTLLDYEFSKNYASELKNHFKTINLTPNLYICHKRKVEMSLLFNRNTFFSPSKYANSENPYGPYSDIYCFKDDPIVELGKSLSV